ncbi:protein-disulfide reductase DsbD [Campylobacter sp. 19-13652]|uniref:protein-disulfide reductase DsbD n=1 Tax=Campylobacter sp. 19-13652 TaxID=2840180 RepID=UPI001C74EDE3|nr:protein-disulfide reductase DsbD [Campylobacter sp. 19-13652]BCX79221.1 thiol:disulfide interchange protein DsbD [Campylobacter sp. 19-13652]
MIRKFIMLLFLSLLTTQIFAKNIDVNEAFVVNLTPAEDRFDVDFILGDERIFIYKNSFSVVVNGENITDKLAIPMGQNKGNYSIIKHDFSLLLPFSLFSKDTSSLVLNYQGCAESGICYRPQVREFSVLKDDSGGFSAKLVRLNGKSVAAKDATDNTSESVLGERGFVDKFIAIFSGDLGNDAEIANSLAGSTAIISAFVFFIYGLALSLTPCVLPMVPILSGIIVSRGGRGGFMASVVYVFAMALAYATFGVVVSLLGGGVQAWLQNEWVLGAMALVFVLLALSMFGAYEIRLPSFSGDRFSKKGGLFGVAIMGVLSTLVVSPCVAAPLAGALLFIARSGDVLFGAIMLFVMALGMGVPLLIIGISSGKWLPKPGVWMDGVKSAFGFVMLAVAAWLVGRVLGDSVVLVLWGAIGLFAVARFGLFVGSASWVRRGALLVLAIYSVLLFIGGVAGGKDYLNPLLAFTGSSVATIHSEPKFIKVSNLNELKNAIKSADGTVMVDFWASWCASCIELDEKTLSNPSVQASLERFVLIKADVSASGAASEEMMRAFEVVGPPALLFFKDGAELKEHRTSGFIPPKAMINLLEAINP